MRRTVNTSLLPTIGRVDRGAVVGVVVDPGMSLRRSIGEEGSRRL